MNTSKCTLENLQANLSLLQPIQRRVEEAVPAFSVVKALAQLVSEYVVSDGKVDTEGMIRFFEAVIPKDAQELEFDTNDKGIQPLPALPVGAMCIKESPERRLIDLACRYFACCSFEFVRGHRYNRMGFHDFFGRVSEVSIIETCDPMSDHRNPADFVFGHLDWAKICPPETVINQDPNQLIEALTRLGFSKVTQRRHVKAGQAVIYHTATNTQHVARVSRVNEKGVIMTISKFFHGHVVEHPVGYVPRPLGGFVTFLNFPKPD